VSERTGEYRDDPVCENFARRIARRKELPIDPDDAYQFAADVLRYGNPPRGFFGRLAKNLDYLDQGSFYKGLDKMAERIKKAVGREPYLALLNGGDSVAWIYDQLLTRGIPKPEGTLDLAHYEVDWEGWFQQYVPKGHKILITDDFSIGGGLITDDMLTAYHSEDYDNRVFLLAASARAESSISQRHAHVDRIGKRILNLSDVLPSGDIALLTYIDSVTDPYRSFRQLAPDRDALFWAWHKVPDNLPELLTGARGLHPLVRPENFPEPY
jgi:hypothetical protein